ncbi:hypothetical protein DE146DRAFT_433306 [Phaeosphaeria sp. MPI-PUGE-AT-0046c]|nr:hypothetical protein DE146DRAFT_433306 [Phaeosphaeria sp. MPI-PUGE-AT-0046c]
MPPIKKPALILDWDAFPPPPPEANEWYPDPDSIARPGDLQDERFNRDPYQDARLRAVQKEFGYHVREDTMSAYLSRAPPVKASSGNQVADGQWPDQEIRSHRSNCTTPIATRENPRSSSLSKRSSTCKIASSIATNGFEGTNSALSSHSVETDIKSHVGIQNPTASSATLRRHSPLQNLPAWASPLEKALSENCSPIPHANGSKPKSIPPHLRRIQNTNSGSLTNPPSCENRVFSNKASSLNAQSKSDPTTAEMEAYLESQSVEKISDTATKDLSIVDPMIAVDKLLETLALTSDLATCTDYGHHLKVSMLANMMKELLEQVFLKLGSKALEDRILEASSLREQMWRKQNTEKLAPNGLLNGHQANGSPEIAVAFVHYDTESILFVQMASQMLLSNCHITVHLMGMQRVT